MTIENAESKPRKNVRSLAQEQKEAKDMANHKRETLKDLIREQVLHTLGEPGDLLRVQVRPLWGSNYRVNVFVGVHAASAKVTNSYFVVADGDGNILESTPKIEKQY
jgi:hypothetical protein